MSTFNPLGHRLKAVAVDDYKLQAEGMVVVEPLIEATLEAANAGNIGVLIIAWDKSSAPTDDNPVKFVATIKGNFDESNVPPPVEAAMSVMTSDEEATLRYLAMSEGACCPMHYVEYLGLRIEEATQRIAKQFQGINEFLKDAPPIEVPPTFSTIEAIKAMSPEQINAELDRLNPSIREAAIKFVEAQAMMALLRELRFKEIDEILGDRLTKDFFGDIFKKHSSD